MKVLVIGQGGREHALVHALAQSSSISEIHAIPGSDGMRREAVCHEMPWSDSEKLISFCLRTEIDFVFVGPEDPLVAGLSDQLRERGILVVGPSQESAQLEGSKIFAKEFMREAEVPASNFVIVDSVSTTMEQAPHFTAPFVLKADGLAGGKGVFICKDLNELKLAATDLFEKRTLGDAGNRALLEQFMPGWELSYLVLTNGKSWETLPLAQDHKRLADGDVGPNTGGMGTVAPMKISSELRSQIENMIVRPSVELLAQRNLLYRGILFIGVMVTAQGPQVLEYNCRFGDPETQVILPLVDGDLGLIFKDLSAGKLQPLKQKNLFASCVVMAAPGYPSSPEKNLPIEGDIESATDLSYFLHAGTKKDPTGRWVTNGGRILNAVGLGSTLRESLEKAYQQTEKAKWMGIQKRMDIGSKSSNEG